VMAAGMRWMTASSHTTTMSWRIMGHEGGEEAVCWRN
jgi:hypothetical protein